MIVYFGEEVEKALRDYIEGSRKHGNSSRQATSGALFYSTQNRRISVSAVQKIW